MALFLFYHFEIDFEIVQINEHNNGEGRFYFDKFQKCNQKIW